jgi:hypothetical protein
VYPLQVVKNIIDARKPNVLVVLETAESMQGLPGENIARYNQVGADCEEGNRSCRLVGQNGRWNFSGMGSQGMYFGTPPASCVGTVTDTNTIQQTATQTQTVTSTATGTGATYTVNGTVTSTAYGTVTSTAYGSSTSTA